MEKTRTPLSSHIVEIGYEDGVLAVRYAPDVKWPEGRLVEYIGVEPDIASQVLTAPSVGSAMHMLIRGRYEYR